MILYPEDYVLYTKNNKKYLGKVLKKNGVVNCYTEWDKSVLIISYNTAYAFWCDWNLLEKITQETNPEYFI